MQKHYAYVYKILCNAISVSFRPVNTGIIVVVIIISIVVVLVLVIVVIVVVVLVV